MFISRELASLQFSRRCLCRTITTGQVVYDENGNVEYDDNGQPKTEAAPATVAGMEVFTSPQTLINGNEPHYDIGPQRTVILPDGSREEGSRTPAGRQTSVIDRFRPFMSLNSFNVNVSPTMGMMSYKTAEMELVLHDRSRLSEISPFVISPSLSNP